LLSGPCSFGVSNASCTQNRCDGLPVSGTVTVCSLGFRSLPVCGLRRYACRALPALSRCNAVEGCHLWGGMFDSLLRGCGCYSGELSTRWLAWVCGRCSPGDRSALQWDQELRLVRVVVGPRLGFLWLTKLLSIPICLGLRIGLHAEPVRWVALSALLRLVAVTVMGLACR
jgi:hypothetical protein